MIKVKRRGSATWFPRRTLNLVFTGKSSTDIKRRRRLVGYIDTRRIRSYKSDAQRSIQSSCIGAFPPFYPFEPVKREREELLLLLLPRVLYANRKCNAEEEIVLIRVLRREERAICNFLLNFSYWTT